MQELATAILAEPHTADLDAGERDGDDLAGHLVLRVPGDGVAGAFGFVEFSIGRADDLFPRHRVEVVGRADRQGHLHARGDQFPVVVLHLHRPVDVRLLDHLELVVLALERHRAVVLAVE